MNAYDRIRFVRLLDSEGHRGEEILALLDREGVHMKLTFEHTKTHCVNEVSL